MKAKKKLTDKRKKELAKKRLTEKRKHEREMLEWWGLPVSY